jgi:adenosylcobinamide kinase/adenosylcobinamide-phosphate guanylyltransferase
MRAKVGDFAEKHYLYRLLIMRRIILITGGQSSGKSLHAERLALELAVEPDQGPRPEPGLRPGPVYVATARTEGMEDRVQRHRERRGPEWTTIEEPLRLGRLSFPGRVILIDCVTLWLTSLLFEQEGRDVFAAATDELERFTAPEATYIFVTNEVGLGGVAASALARDFADLQGRVNQHIASLADSVTLVVAGIPVKIK